MAIPANRLLPLIVAVALFMENMDSTIIATSLPAIAKDIGTNPLALKLAITSYLLSLAVFIPMSGWTADRFGTRTVFRAAIAIFMLGSIGCALSSSLTDFVIARVVQGIGGAMMTPVGRLVLVRSFSRRELVGAMAWLSTPALIGPMIGPPVGGFITTYLTWHWIFLINVPIGLMGIALVSRYFESIKEENPDRFDFIGMALSGLGIGGVAFGFSIAGLNFLPWTISAGLIAAGAAFIAAYLWHARRTPNPAIDLTLFKIPTFSATVTGGFLFRLGIGALAFLLPLMLQVGFGFSPFQSGLITFASAVGAMTMKLGVTSILRRLGFRNVLIVNALISAAFLGVCAAFQSTTPMTVMFVVLLVGGFFRSLEFTLINALAYADVEPARAGRATSLVSVAQQLSISTGVAIGALLVEMSVRLKTEPTITADDFPMAFLAVAAISATAAFIFMRMPRDAGEEMANRIPAPTEGGDQRIS
jgi:EmrB/QacA subfamily drug resistance transporter